MLILIVNQILKMLLILILGYACYRLKLIDQAGNKSLANLLLMVVNPLVAVMSLQIDYRPELVHGLLISYLLAILAHLAGIAISQIMVRKTGNEDYAIERFAIIYSNCGFIGIPLIQSTLGSEGVFYLTAYMTVFNIFSWTHGVSLMTGKTSLRDLRKGLLTPMILACLLGLVLFFARIRIPSVPADAMNYVASMNTSLAMLIAGMSVAQTDLKKMFHNIRLYYIIALKLLVMPAIVLLILAVLPVPSDVAMTILIAAACPAAATGTAFALKFQKNYRYSSELYSFSTLLSLVTIPLFAYAGERLLF